MKKVIFGLLMMASSTSFAQKNQYEAMKDFPEGTTLKGYYGVKKNSEDFYDGTPYDYEFNVYQHNSIHNKPYALTVVSEKKSKEEYQFRGPATNHYSEPSIISLSGEEGNYRGYVALGDHIYYLEDINDASNPTSFEIKKVYVKPKEKEEGKKLSMKDRVAAAKKALKGWPNLNRVDHEVVLQEYFTKMATKQQSTELTETEETELAAIVQAEVDLQASIKEKNDAYWASEQGQRKLAEMRAEDIVLINDTGSAFGICYGQGAYTTLDPGDTHNVDCTYGPVYRGYKEAGVVNLRKGELLFEPNGNGCGRKINISTLL